jgi:hypothetical protein
MVFDPQKTNYAGTSFDSIHQWVLAGKCDIVTCAVGSWIDTILKKGILCTWHGFNISKVQQMVITIQPKSKFIALFPSHKKRHHLSPNQLRADEIDEYSPLNLHRALLITVIEPNGKPREIVYDATIAQFGFPNSKCFFSLDKYLSDFAANENCERSSIRGLLGVIKSDNDKSNMLYHFIDFIIECHNPKIVN